MFRVIYVLSMCAATTTLTSFADSTANVGHPRPLVEKVGNVLDAYYARPLNTRDDAPWSVLHWSIAFGVDAQVSLDGPDGEWVTAIGWLCCNRPTAGKRLASLQGGRLSLAIAPGLQGHHGQFLAMLAQSRVQSDYLLQVGQREMTVADLVAHEQRTCRSGMELTFKLIGLSHYVSSQDVWRNARGDRWNLLRILQEELQQPIDPMQACCGGTHRLFALNYAVDRRRREGLPINGPWRDAQRRVESYQRRAFALQNGDGSFSTAWFQRRENRSDVTRRLTTSGHVLELLAFSLPTEQLEDPRFEQALWYVANLLEGNLDRRWHPGALGHALHALAIYEQRAAGATPGERRDRILTAAREP